MLCSLTSPGLNKSYNTLTFLHFESFSTNSPIIAGLPRFDCDVRHSYSPPKSDWTAEETGGSHKVVLVHLEDQGVSFQAAGRGPAQLVSYADQAGQTNAPSRQRAGR